MLLNYFYRLSKELPIYIGNTVQESFKELNNKLEKMEEELANIVMSTFLEDIKRI